MATNLTRPRVTEGQSTMSPSQRDLMTVSQRLKAELDGKAFIRKQRKEITDLVRLVSGEDSTRLKHAMSADLENELLKQGVRCFPSIGDTDTSDMLRLFHAGSVVSQLVDALVTPSEHNDGFLAEVLTKLKGRWKWGEHDGTDRTASRSST